MGIYQAHYLLVCGWACGMHSILSLNYLCKCMAASKIEVPFLLECQIPAIQNITHEARTAYSL